MKIKTSQFDPAIYFETEASCDGLLADAAASGHADYIAAAAGIVARARALRAQSSPVEPGARQSDFPGSGGLPENHR